MKNLKLSNLNENIIPFIAEVKEKVPQTTNRNKHEISTVVHTKYAYDQWLSTTIDGVTKQEDVNNFISKTLVLFYILPSFRNIFEGYSEDEKESISQALYSDAIKSTTEYSGFFDKCKDSILTSFAGEFNKNSTALTPKHVYLTEIRLNSTDAVFREDEERDFEIYKADSGAVGVTVELLAKGMFQEYRLNYDKVGNLFSAFDFTGNNVMESEDIKEIDSAICEAGFHFNKEVDNNDTLVNRIINGASDLVKSGLDAAKSVFDNKGTVIDEEINATEFNNYKFNDEKRYGHMMFINGEVRPVIIGNVKCLITYTHEYSETGVLLQKTLAQFMSFKIESNFEDGVIVSSQDLNGNSIDSSFDAILYKITYWIPGQDDIDDQQEMVVNYGKGGIWEKGRNYGRALLQPEVEYDSSEYLKEQYLEVLVDRMLEYIPELKQWQLDVKEEDNYRNSSAFILDEKEVVITQIFDRNESNDGKYDVKYYDHGYGINFPLQAVKVYEAGSEPTYDPSIRYLIKVENIHLKNDFAWVIGNFVLNGKSNSDGAQVINVSGQVVHAPDIEGTLVYYYDWDRSEHNFDPEGTKVFG